MQNEFLSLQLENLNKKIEDYREIYFSLNDYLENLDKTYYFTFNVFCDGVVKIEQKNFVENVQLFLGETPIILGKEFYLKKGNYQVKVSANLSQNTTLNFYVKGYVKYKDESFIKVLNATNYSFIAVQNSNQLLLYKYNGEVTFIEKIATSSFDMYLENQEVVLLYITENGFAKKTYLQDFSNSVIEQIEIEGLSEIKCYKTEKVGLYAVKDGFLVKIDTENYKVFTLNIKAKNLLAGDESCLIFRDFDNRIKLCNLSISQ